MSLGVTLQPKPKRIGVLALQGDFAKHAEVCRSLGAEVIEVRKPEDLNSCQGLIIPGGESTVILRQIDYIHLREPIIKFSKANPIFGTCAGLIVLAKKIEGFSMNSLGLLDVSVQRNAYGRQIASFSTLLDIHFKPKESITIEASFIRAPRITSCASTVKILGKFNNEPVLVQQGNILAATFHTEVEGISILHQYFLDQVKRGER